jgi:hypothetical protein
MPPWHPVSCKPCIPSCLSILPSNATRFNALPLSDHLHAIRHNQAGRPIHHHAPALYLPVACFTQSCLTCSLPFLPRATGRELPACNCTHLSTQQPGGRIGGLAATCLVSGPHGRILTQQQPHHLAMHCVSSKVPPAVTFPHRSCSSSSLQRMGVTGCGQQQQQQTCAACRLFLDGPYTVCSSFKMPCVATRPWAIGVHV